jgi:hypothetical protein
MMPYAPENEQLRLLKYLLAFIRQVLQLEFEERTYEDRALVEVFMYNLVRELLEIAIIREEFAELIVQSIWSFLEEFASALAIEDLDKTLCVIVPSLLGLMRAMEETQYVFSNEYFRPLLDLSGKLLHTSVLDRVREAIQAALEKPKESFAFKLVHASMSYGGLSGNLLILHYLRLMTAYLARHIRHHSPEDGHPIPPGKNIEELWDNLRNYEAHTMLGTDDSVQRVLRGAYVMAGQYFSEIYSFAISLRDEEKPCTSDLYGSEIMAASLSVATLSAVHLHNIDEALLSKLDSVLVTGPLCIGNFSDATLHYACLNACTVLVKK